MVRRKEHRNWGFVQISVYRWTDGETLGKTGSHDPSNQPRNGRRLSETQKIYLISARLSHESGSYRRKKIHPRKRQNSKTPHEADRKWQSIVAGRRLSLRTSNLVVTQPPLHHHLHRLRHHLVSYAFIRRTDNWYPWQSSNSVSTCNHSQHNTHSWQATFIPTLSSRPPSLNLHEPPHAP